MSKNTEDLNDEKEEIIPFKVVSEPWDEYEIYDGTMIKTKCILINIIKTSKKNEKGEHLSFFNSQNLTGVFSPINIRGKPDKNYLVEELEKNITKKNLFFKQIKDGGMNIYETEKHKMEIKRRVTSIDLTSKYDARGNPGYIVRSEIQIIMSEKETEAE